MKPSDFKLLKKEVLPAKQINMYLGLEFLLNTYHEINFSDSKEKVQENNIEELNIDIWYSWN